MRTSTEQALFAREAASPCACPCRGGRLGAPTWQHTTACLHAHAVAERGCARRSCRVVPSAIRLVAHIWNSSAAATPRHAWCASSSAVLVWMRRSRAVAGGRLCMSSMAMRSACCLGSWEPIMQCCVLPTSVRSIRRRTRSGERSIPRLRMRRALLPQRHASAMPRCVRLLPSEHRRSRRRFVRRRGCVLLFPHARCENWHAQRGRRLPKPPWQAVCDFWSEWQRGNHVWGIGPRLRST